LKPSDPDLTGAKPLAAGFSPDVANALAKKLHELASELEKRAWNQGGEPAETEAREALEVGLAKGDEAKVREALDKLAERGTHVSAGALEAAAAKLARGSGREARAGESPAGVAGAGGPSSPGETPTNTNAHAPDATSSTSVESARQARSGATWRVSEAERRYRAALEESR
jgi:hypothetical protein